jgi:ketosteroid isomerase-like protein
LIGAPAREILDGPMSQENERFRGHGGTRKWLGVWSDAWGNWRIEDLEVRPVGEDRGLALFLMVVTGQESGIELSRRDAIVCTLRAGKIAEIVYYNEQPEALEAVGLSEQAS